MWSMATAKVKVKAAVKAKKMSKGAKGPTGRPDGRTLGLGVQATWVELFEQNEKASKTKKRTDGEIAAFMHNEFKGRDSKVFDQVQLVRTRYNKGGLAKGSVPKVQSRRFNEDGEPVDVRPGRQPSGEAKPKATVKVKVKHAAKA
jgi:hypothetical protein